MEIGERRNHDREGTRIEKKKRKEGGKEGKRREGGEEREGGGINRRRRSPTGSYILITAGTSAIAMW
jgi:hypothetical protein